MTNEIPYADKVRFYANRDTKKLITSEVKDIGKGWCQVRVGKIVEKQRGVCSPSNILESKYPKYKEVSTFTELSYHKPKSGKIENYGTNKYNLGYSKLKPIDKPYTLESPVKSTEKNRFGKIVNKVQFHQWEDVTLDWRPDGDSKKLFVKHRIANPLTGENKVIFKSQEFNVKDSNSAIKLFKSRVNKIK